MKTIKNYIGNINSVLLIIYCDFIFSTSVYAAKTDDLTVFVLRAVWVIIVLSVLICPLILKKAEKITLKADEKKLSPKGKRLLFFGVFLFFIADVIIWYPGGWSVDGINQLNQAMTNSYNDWHPVFQTVAAIKIPLLLTGNRIAAPVVFQVVALSAALSYALDTVYEFTNKKIFIAAAAFCFLNGNTSLIAVFVWKDVSFLICALLLVTFSARIYFSEGEWAKKPLNCVFFVFTAAAAMLVRHNGILFVVPLLLAVFLMTEKKRAAIMLLGIIVLFAGVKYPVYSALNVEKPGYRTMETVGLPMSVIGSVVSQDPESLDEQTLDFAYDFLPKEVWEKEFTKKGFNTVKHNSNANWDVVEKFGTKGILEMTLKCIKASPETALSEFFYLTGTAYSVTSDYATRDYPYVSSNDYGFSLYENGAVNVVRGLISAYSLVCVYFLPHLFMYAGAMHLILLISLLAKCRFNKLKDIKKALLIISPFVYNIGSVLFISDSGDANRFFFYTFLITPILLIILYRDEKSLPQKLR